jgi:hypothetical protein
MTEKAGDAASSCCAPQVADPATCTADWHTIVGMDWARWATTSHQARYSRRPRPGVATLTPASRLSPVKGSSQETPEASWAACPWLQDGLPAPGSKRPAAFRRSSRPSRSAAVNTGSATAVASPLPPHQQPYAAQAQRPDLTAAVSARPSFISSVRRNGRDSWTQRLMKPPLFRHTAACPYVPVHQTHPRVMPPAIANGIRGLFRAADRWAIVKSQPPHYQPGKHRSSNPLNHCQIIQLH